MSKLIDGESQNMKSNVYLYCRVSTRKQQESENLQRQKEQLIQYCNEELEKGRQAENIENNNKGNND